MEGKYGIDFVDKYCIYNVLDYIVYTEHFILYIEHK